MKSILRRITALALCAVLLCSTALASDALGGKIYGYTLDICDDTTLTREVMWSSSRSGLRTENYVTYNRKQYSNEKWETIFLPSRYMLVCIYKY